MAVQKRKNSGFTLMEVLLTAALILILVALALPILSEARKRSAEKTCALNRAAIQSEADAALIRGRGRTDTEILEGLKDELKSCRCPDGGTYTLEKRGDGTFEVRCSVHGTTADTSSPSGG